MTEKKKKLGDKFLNQGRGKGGQGSDLRNQSLNNSIVEDEYTPKKPF
jgi:hypothetical protein